MYVDMGTFGRLSRNQRLRRVGLVMSKRPCTRDCKAFVSMIIIRDCGSNLYVGMRVVEMF